MENTAKIRKCIWCLKSVPEVTFDKKAHTIPRSLGGQNYNRNVCDIYNEYFGSRHNNCRYSIEEALKEAFVISRKRFLEEKTKRKVGRFKSKFFDVKRKNGKYKLHVKPSFRFSPGFQTDLGRAFKRGLYKMVFEELDRQQGNGHSTKFDLARRFARFDDGDPPVYYFTRLSGIFLMFNREAETPVLFFDRIDYLISDEKFMEIEFLGHVFGFPISYFTPEEMKNYLSKSFSYKKGLFKECILIHKLTDVDISLNILN